MSLANNLAPRRLQKNVLRVKRVTAITLYSVLFLIRLTADVM